MYGIIDTKKGNKKPSLSASKPTKEGTLSVPRICSIDNCTKPHKARSYCMVHWRKWYYHGDPNWTPPIKEVKLCKLDNCDNVQQSKGYCRKHALRAWRGKSLTDASRKDPRPAIIRGETALLPLGVEAKDGYAIVDKEYAYLDKYKWNYTLRNCVAREKGEKLHHLIVGKPPKGFVVDHANRNPRDNRRDNLRFVTNAENARNISMQKNNTSGYRGVWKTSSGKWEADIKVNYKKIRLGTFIDIHDAAKAYNQASIKYFGEYGVLNKITDISYQSNDGGMK